MLSIVFLLINKHTSFIKNNLRTFIETPNISGEFTFNYFKYLEITERLIMKRKPSKLLFLEQINYI